MSIRENILQRKIGTEKARFRLALSAESECKQTHDWNQTRREFPDCCAHALFEEHAARTREALALICGGKQLSYAELNARANRLARYLQLRGVGPEQLVGVRVERSLEMVVALLAIWKAGGAWLPLDPRYPARRLEFMLKDSSARILLTESRHRESLAFEHDNTVLLDVVWQEIANESAENLSSEGTPADLAYVIYTSGSKGEPKGVMIPHRGLVNYLCWSREAYISPGCGPVPVHSSISFDLTITALFTPLVAGAAVEILAEHATEQSLATALRSGPERGLVKITPAHLDLLNHQLRENEAAGKTLLFVIGGEKLAAESLELWRQSAPATRIINEYGPTETVVGCCVHEVTAADPHNGPVPIGRPIANTQVYILDADMKPLPPGAIGELFIGGAGVARGYINRPELTRERFLPDPFSPRGDARLYKTGDLARYRADGVIEYLGRADDQVKLRGYRIELGEIEANLVGHPAVKSCAVVAREDVTGNKQLAGYVATKPQATLSADELRRFLNEKLPEYMVPAQFVFVEQMPLTPNGKIDRQALPAPSPSNTSRACHFVAPRNATESALAAVWSELLHVERVGIHDDFFELGGHSLLAIKAVSRIRDVLNIELPAQILFDSPTVAELATWMGVSGAEATSAQTIAPRASAGPAPLTFSQERLWFLHQLAPESPAYNMVDVIRFEGAHEAGPIKNAVRELICRHEMLRTVFTHRENQPLQTVLSEFSPVFEEIDLRGLAPAKREAEWRRIVEKHGRQPFSLADAPAHRWTLVRLRDEYKLLLVIHHILADEWSMEVVHKEVRQLEADFTQGRASSLGELPMQYADFAAWQRETFDEKALEGQRAFWKEELAGAPTVLELPVDKPRPALQSFRGATETFELPKELLARLKSLAREEQATLFMTLTAGFQALLRRYTGQKDILVGTPISARTRSETEGLIGCFLNTIVLRAQFEDDATFRSILRQTRGRAMRAYAHADLPLEKVVAELAPERDLSRSPLFQVMFILHDADGVSEVSSVSGNAELATGTSKFDLTMVMSETAQGLAAMVEYSSDLFEAQTMRRFCGHYGNLLEAAVQHPDRSVLALPMLTDREQEELLSDWNQTAADFPGKHLGLHQLIENQAWRTPDHAAVIFDRQILTYRELNGRANQFAHHLRSLGVGPDMLVGLCVERSLEMVVALLGILKSGAAYVPLDPSFPQNRLAYMMEDSRMRLLVTQRSLHEKLGIGAPATVCMDSDWRKISQQCTASQGLPSISSKNLAYVLYTSGSTGKPKGVEVPHGAIVNFLRSMQREPGIAATDSLLAVTTLSFDIAGLELYLPLISGAHVILASQQEAQDPERLLALMRHSGCTMMQATPAMWRALIHTGWRGSPGLKALCGGEALPRDLAKELLPRCAELWNMYGPTETTVWSTTQRITSADGTISIGRPIANTTVYVFDEHHNVAPVGVLGELYIGGEGLARGYLRREELTRERFVPCPFTPNALLYRTGDLARWLPDGTLDWRGRADSQVKIRGFRIELGEIEAVLGSHPAVRNCAVIVREDAPGEKTLAAYFEPRLTLTPSVRDLRAHLERTLPAYMIPSAFVAMQKLPLTPNGKLNRQALPAPADATRVSSNFVLPRDPLENLLAQLWCKVLNVKRVGVHDNFFELGGHSLLAVRLVLEVEKLAQTRLPLAMLLNAPTVAELADVLRGKQWKPSWSSLVPIRPGGSRPPLFFMHSQRGNVLEYYPLASLLEPDWPVYGLQARGLDGRIAKGASVEEMAAAHVRELRAMQPEGPYYLGGFCFGGLLALEAAQQLTAARQEVALVAMIQTMHPRAVRFKDGLGLASRLWYKATKRLDLEMENLSYRGKSYVIERLRHVWDVLRARATIVLDRKTGYDREPADLPLLYVFEALGIEHWKAMEKYEPRPYAGRVVLFRASKQLQGINADEYLGWKSVLNDNLELHEVHGHQQNLLLEPNVSRLAQKLGERLQDQPQRTNHTAKAS